MSVSLCKHIWVELNTAVVFCDSCGQVEIGEVANV